MKSTVVDSPSRSQICGMCPVFCIVALLAPASVYFVMAVAALLFDITEPVEWVARQVASSTWASFLFIASVGFGPAMGVVASMINRGFHGPNRTLIGFLGALALFLIICYPVFALCLARFSPFYD